MEAFEKYLPDDVQIVSCHSLHGPDVESEGQPLVGLPALHGWIEYCAKY
jgi:prephenate dehydrogenase